MSISATMPKVSIITPVYQLIEGGREAYFRQLVESVRTQSYGVDNIEHVIIDGASTDGTVELIKEYADKGYFAHWRSEKDTGIYNAMNKGGHASSGKYLMFINSDDYLLPHGVKESVEALEREKADYSIGDVEVAFTHVQKRQEEFRTWHTSMERILLCYNPCHQGLMMRKDVFMECGMFDEGYTIAADVAQFFELHMRRKKYVLVPKSVAVMRDCGISWSQREQGINQCVDIAMKYYGNVLGLTRDEVHFLIDDGTDKWFMMGRREALYCIIDKVKTNCSSSERIKLAQELYYAILSLTFDDASGRDEKKMSLCHVVDCVWTRSKRLPFKRRCAFLLAALAKKMKLYALIKPLRDIIVAYYERKP